MFMPHRESKARDPKHETVMVAMSGGVDSSTAAAVLLEQGYRVVGATMLLWADDPDGFESGCCGTRDLSDARAVCASLGIRHYGIDLREEFDRDVVEPFTGTYLKGRTPNPCILCNQHLKFRYLLHRALAVGADRLATGHYARITGTGPYGLSRGRDAGKDQSYFLFPMGQEVLSRLLLPLGGMTKEEVRQKAGSLQLPVHEKPESQEICFIPPGGLKGFLKDRAGGSISPGPMLDTGGREIGRHQGICFYTVGQRTGLGIAAPEPLYVVSIDAEANAVIVGSREEAASTGLEADDATWLAGDPPPGTFRAQVQIRYRHRPASATVRNNGNGRFTVIFDEPQHGVAPGQAAVVYDGDQVLGGGWISQATSGSPKSQVPGPR